VCVFHNHSITTDISCALYVLSAPNNALCIAVTALLRSMLPHLTEACMSKTKTSQKYVTPLDRGVYVENCHGTYVVLHFRHVLLTKNNIMRSLWSNYVASVQFYLNRSTPLEHLHKVVTMYFNTFSSMQSCNTTLLSVFMLTRQQSYSFSSSLFSLHHCFRSVSTNKKSPICFLRHYWLPGLCQSSHTWNNIFRKVDVFP
jgi:hypothetical protein